MDLQWRKSSYSGNDSDCVELAWSGGEAKVRDSKNPAGERLSLTPAALSHLLTATREF
ncbi:DUF397 domain-containing protein [Actinokineospora sp.]|uniref:DUF397 domain-containing protein n=1 Tax=Actinokineospora sp. TaxID=1872133 RepID=UPI00403761DC